VSTLLIGDGLVVAFHYTLKDDAEKQIETSVGKAPLHYLHGAGNIVPGLEAALVGKTAGDAVSVVVELEDGYGVRDERGVLEVPRTQFPADAPLELGMQFGVKGPDEQMYPVWVTEVGEETVTVDLNHPMAGMRLHFEVEVESVREATDEEKAHGHPHV